MKWTVNFKKHSFEVRERTPGKLPVQQLAADPLNLLAPYPLMGFEFCRYWDQALDLRREGQSFLAFGTCDLGVFLLDEHRRVRLHGAENTLFDSEIVPVNHDFKTFVASYCLFLAAVFVMKSHLDKSVRGAEDASARFERDMHRIQSDALDEGNFWSQMLFMLEEDEIQIRPPILQYFDEGRAQEGSPGA